MNKLSNLAVHFSSERTDWETPQYFYEKLDKEFHFNIDVCATSKNAKHHPFISPEQDALKQIVEFVKNDVCKENEIILNKNI